MGTAVSATGFTNRSAYISNNDGANHAYTPNANSLVHFYRDITFPAGETNISLSFTFLCDGDYSGGGSLYDGLQVSLASTSTTPTASSATGGGNVNGPLVAGATIIGNILYNGFQGYQQAGTVTITIPAALAGNTTEASTRRIIFSWRNDNDFGILPPAAIDNIRLESSCQASPTAGATLVGTTTATVTWQTAAGASGYEVRYRIVGQPDGVASWASPTIATGGGTSQLNLTGLNPVSLYEYQVKPTGGVSCLLFSASGNFFTADINDLCANAKPLPLSNVFTCNNPTAGSTNGATPSPASTPGLYTRNGTDGKDVWFSFALSNPVMELTITNLQRTLTNGNFMVELYKGNCNELELLNARSVSNGNSLTIDQTYHKLTAGQTILVRVYDSNPAANATFDLCLYAANMAPFCGGNVLFSPANNTTVSTTSFNLEMLRPQFATAYRIMVGTTNPPADFMDTLVINGTGSVDAYQLPAGVITQPNTIYYWRVQPLNHYGAAQSVEQCNSQGTVQVRSFTSPAAGAIRYTNGWMYGRSGLWSDARNWAAGRVPNCDDRVLINHPTTGTVVTTPPPTVILDGPAAEYVADSLVVAEGATLSLPVAGKKLTIGCTQANNRMHVEGTLQMHGGDLTVNGSLQFGAALIGSATKWSMKAGTLLLNINDGTIENSLPSGSALAIGGLFAHQGITVTGGGGKIVIPNPHRQGTTKTVLFNASNVNTNTYNLDGVTLQLGNGTVGQPSVSGFSIDLVGAGKPINLGAVVADTRTDLAANRLVTSESRWYIDSLLDIKAGTQVRFTSSFNPIIGGNISNQGTLVAPFMILGNRSQLLSGANIITGVAAANRAQTIAGTGVFTHSTANNNFNISQFQIINNHPVGVTLQVPLMVNNLELTEGVVHCTDVNLLTIGNATATPSLSVNQGYVQGPLRRYIRPDAVNQNWVFPIGLNGQRRTATVSYTTVPATGGFITTRFIPSAPGNNGLPLADGPYTGINTTPAEGYWQLSQGESGLTNGVFTLQLNGEGFTGISTPAELRIVQRPNADAPWSLTGQHLAGTGTIASRSQIAAIFGQFSMAGRNPDNPLPVNLLQFTGTRQGQRNLLQWLVATESNFSHYQLERSLGQNQPFTTVVQLNGGLTTYSYADEPAVGNHWLYRLKMVDMDGIHKYSPVVSISQPSIAVIRLYPNPASTYVIATGLPARAAVRLVNAEGRTIPLTLQPGGRISLPPLPAGSYQLIATHQQSIVATAALIIKP